MAFNISDFFHYICNFFNSTSFSSETKLLRVQKIKFSRKETFLVSNFRRKFCWLQGAEIMDDNWCNPIFPDINNEFTIAVFKTFENFFSYLALLIRKDKTPLISELTNFKN